MRGFHVSSTVTVRTSATHDSPSMFMRETPSTNTKKKEKGKKRADQQVSAKGAVAHKSSVIRSLKPLNEWN